MRDLELQDIIAIDDLREMMHFFHEGAKLSVGIIDNRKNWLISLGWQDICKKFHLKHHDTRKNCLLSKDRITKYLQTAEHMVFRCPNGLYEVAIPLFLDSRILGYFFLSQFFQEAPDLDYFKRQALAHGFNLNEYLAAVEKVPIVPEARVEHLIRFFTLFFDLLMRLGSENQQRQKAEQQMEQAKEQLELRVHERTSELNEALAEIGDLAAQLKESLQQVEHLAVTDTLTQAFNRRKFDEIVDQSTRQEGTALKRFSLIMLDIDHFKQVNDSHGHSIGDEVLKHLCRVIRGVIRQGDQLIRWGGEEFLILLPETTVVDAEPLAERIRSEVAVATFAEVGSITISLGVAQLLPDDTIDHLIKRVDHALYQAKQAGRNRVVVASYAGSSSAGDGC